MAGRVTRMQLDKEFIVKELMRKPRYTFIGRDSSTRMYRVDWRENRRHLFRLASDLDHAMTICRNLQLHSRIVAFQIMRKSRPATPWIPIMPRELRIGIVF